MWSNIRILAYNKPIKFMLSSLKNNWVGNHVLTKNMHSWVASNSWALCPTLSCFIHNQLNSNKSTTRPHCKFKLSSSSRLTWWPSSEPSLRGPKPLHHQCSTFQAQPMFTSGNNKPHPPTLSKTKIWKCVRKYDSPTQQVNLVQENKPNLCNIKFDEEQLCQAKTSSVKYKIVFCQ